jgi:hypothetical protein
MIMACQFGPRPPRLCGFGRVGTFPHLSAAQGSAGNAHGDAVILLPLMLLESSSCKNPARLNSISPPTAAQCCLDAQLRSTGAAEQAAVMENWADGSGALSRARAGARFWAMCDQRLLQGFVRCTTFDVYCN